MKVVHKQSAGLSIQRAREAEQSGDIGAAISDYEALVKKDPLDEFSYNRLMILYRKNRDLKKELVVIKAGIKAFTNHYKERKNKSAKGNARISRLSKSILKSTGLVSKTGEQLYQEGPLSRWEKRKALVEKKLAR